MARRNWNREELIKALELYCRTPFGKIDKGNPEIIKLAQELGRSPSAVGLKLANFAHIDPTLDREGFSNHGKLDQQIWDEFFDDVSEVLSENRANFRYPSLPLGTTFVIDDEGAERVVRVRLRQQYFRRTILEDYRGECCVTGLKVEKLLVASHIVPWSENESNRVNPHNGLCLNALHDKAFDRGLITVDSDNRVVLSSELKHHGLKGADYIARTEGQVIQMPEKFEPRQEFLEYHRDNIFVA